MREPKIVGLAAACALVVSASLGLSHASVPADQARAVSVVPPGESGFINATRFVTGEANGSWGPHFADQLGLYESFRYKSLQFAPPPAHLPSHGSITIRDAFGVPAIYASDRASLLQAYGYAMAQDRLFQMDLFRRAGEGRLAAILGQGYVAMDEDVRTVSEGSKARLAEVAAYDRAHPDRPPVAADLSNFSAGVNRYIQEATTNPAKMPIEFVLLGDLPIKPWTPDDTLAFGEYAGRFFGEFGHAELEMASELNALTQKFGAVEGGDIFDDLYPLDDPSAPVTVPASVGVFPRHTAPRVTTGTGYVNHDPLTLAGAAKVAAAQTNIEATVAAIRKAIGLHGFGSNEFVVDGAHTADGHPLLVSEPQTGWAAPSFFWEVELHGGGFDERGVTVPGLPFIVIGRNATSAWAVTSALDANADTFAEKTNAAGTSYFHDGAWHAFATHTETITCHTPPTALLSLPDTSSVCKSLRQTITVRRSVHGPIIASAPGVAYSRESVVDRRIVESAEGWTDAGAATTVAQFSEAASRIAFGFNFMYVNVSGDAAYFHLGRYPIRPADIDPRLPIPGTGEWDWQGFETWDDQPHAIDPPEGYLANWNNKPAVGWYSKGLLGSTVPEGRPNITTWGPTHQVEPIQSTLAGYVPTIQFWNMRDTERYVSSVDNRARSWMPSVLSAIDTSGDPSLAAARAALAAWDFRRLDANQDGKYDAPGLAIFDRWVEHMLKRTFVGLPPEVFDVASGIGSNGKFRSADNGDVPTFKTENALFGLLTHALRGDARVDYFGSAGRDATIVAALRDALAELKGTWSEPAETTSFAAQGAGSVPSFTPLLDRGSYGQIVEPGGAPIGTAS
jgi:penicillin amidase